jgi:hypothetical protein
VADSTAQIGACLVSRHRRGGLLGHAAGGLPTGMDPRVRRRHGSGYGEDPASLGYPSDFAIAIGGTGPVEMDRRGDGSFWRLPSAGSKLAGEAFGDDVHGKAAVRWLTKALTERIALLQPTQTSSTDHARRTARTPP